MCVSEYSCLQKPEGQLSLELEIEMVVSCMMWMLNSNLGSPEGQSVFLTNNLSSQPQQKGFLKWFYYTDLFVFQLKTLWSLSVYYCKPFITLEWKMSMAYTWEQCGLQAPKVTKNGKNSQWHLGRLLPRQQLNTIQTVPKTCLGYTNALFEGKVCCVECMQCS